MQRLVGGMSGCRAITGGMGDGTSGKVADGSTLHGHLQFGCRDIGIAVRTAGDGCPDTGVADRVNAASREGRPGDCFSSAGSFRLLSHAASGTASWHTAGWFHTFDARPLCTSVEPVPSRTAGQPAACPNAHLKPCHSVYSASKGRKRSHRTLRRVMLIRACTTLQRSPQPAWNGPSHSGPSAREPATLPRVSREVKCPAARPYG